jgi:hypothetical protein
MNFHLWAAVPKEHQAVKSWWCNVLHAPACGRHHLMLSLKGDSTYTVTSHASQGCLCLTWPFLKGFWCFTYSKRLNSMFWIAESHFMIVITAFPTEK